MKSIKSKGKKSSLHPCIIVGAGKMGLLHGSLIEKSERGTVISIVDNSIGAQIVVKGMGLKKKVYSSWWSF